MEKRREVDQLRREKLQLEARLNEHKTDGRCRHTSLVTSQQSTCSLRTPASAPSFTSEQLSADTFGMPYQFGSQASLKQPMDWHTAQMRGGGSVGSPLVVRGGACASRLDQSLVPSPFTPKTDQSVTLFSFDAPEKYDVTHSCVTSATGAHNQFELTSQYAFASSPHSVASVSPRPRSVSLQSDVIASQLQQVRGPSVSSVLGDVTLTLEHPHEQDEFLEALDEFLEENNNNNCFTSGFNAPQ